ncbi:hypothetical protein HYH03_011859 [Edaphochlamys debaryana]|uniref:ABM domain-containing protein n=1 Tax=Edaphochlamys debaryana TaxID=47281 RepID=A0A835XT31_9CHLO|nr:hypothetical protein HYH03_011859 [Edaphochlamys debaryana]|eukprot:KAG2489753.1 hypothetical protein HYH03_011859 [Edaphochlamys debaryana]
MARAAPAAAAAALLLLALSACAAARSAPSDGSALLGGGVRLSGSDALQWIRSSFGRKGKGDDFEDMPAYIATRFTVDPTLHDKFIDAWGDLQKSLDKARGLDFYQLSLEAGNNVYFWAYTEWDSFADLMDHGGCGAAKDFMDFIDDHDIMIEMFPLKEAGNTKKEYRTHREGERASAAARAAAAADLARKRGRDSHMEDFDPREEPAHVAITFHVPPSMREEFEDTFEEVQGRVADEEDANRFYVLRRIGTLNHHYVLRAAWDSLDDWLDHVTSKTFRSLREFTEDKGIEWYAHPFRVLFTSEGKGEDV